MVRGDSLADVHLLLWLKHLICFCSEAPQHTETISSSPCEV